MTMNLFRLLVRSRRSFERNYSTLNSDSSKYFLYKFGRLILGTNISSEEAAHIITRAVITVRVATAFLLPATLLTNPPTTIISHSAGLRSPSSNLPAKHVVIVLFCTAHRPIVD